MNNYPRIYSLSTIGIKQHFNADYLMHPYRTDFSGESGSGKSMVSDMVQLILIGSGNFLSSTKGNKPREVKGMLLPVKGKSTARGYMFMNVEVKPNQYLVIGAYIESTSNQSQLFIIQRGYNWDELLPFNSPIYNDSLVFEDKIFPLNEIPDRLENAGNGILKRFNRVEYHQKLYEHGIVSYDLTKKDILQSYGSILRSFSRGKGFNVDSQSLKNFLFGSDDQNSIKNKYENEIKNINTDFHEHKRYSEEISLIKNKRSSIKNVVKKHRAYIYLFENYSITKKAYWKSKQEAANKELIRLNKEYQIVFVEKSLIKIRTNNLEINNLDRLSQLLKEKSSFKNKKTSISDRDRLESKLRTLLTKKEGIGKMENWLKANQFKLDEVRKWFVNEFSKKESLRKLSEFGSALKSKGLLEMFESSIWYSDPQKAKDLSLNKENELQTKIDELQTLLKFSDVDDKDSLSAWAFENLPFPVGLNEESILIYFQQFSKNKPHELVKGSRYLPFPEELFSELDIKEENEFGFWLNLDGVYEFIQTDKKRYLNFSDPVRVKSDLFKQKNQIQNELKNVLTELDEVKKLNTFLLGFPEIDDCLQIYRIKNDILEYEIDESIVDIDLGKFEKIIEDYRNKDVYLNNLNTVQLDLNEMDSSEKELNRVDSEIREIVSVSFKGEKTESITPKRLSEKKESLRSDTNLIESELSSFVSENNLSQELIVAQSNIDFEDSSMVNLVVEKNSSENRYKDCKTEIDKNKSIIDKSKAAIKNVSENYFDELGKDLEINEINKLFNPDEGNSSLKDRVNSARISFNTTFDDLKEKDPNMHYGDQRDIGELAHNLLPTIFKTQKVNFDLIEENIEDRLNKLTKDVQEIGSRKIEILKKVFKDVRSTYDNYLIQINRIDSDLRKRDITGGNRARLDHKKSIDYPIEWLTTFRKQLDSEINHVGMFEELKSEIDINKMMVKAFQQAGGKPDAEPDELIDPKSYFDLEFNLTLENGEMNSGSNGQTYTGNALLGLARLSLLDGNGKGIKVMPIDEAEGLGGNYDLLHDLAKKEKYQIISMGIETTGDIVEGEQYIYIMNENKISDYESYVPPVAILSGGDLIDDIESYISNQ